MIGNPSDPGGSCGDVLLLIVTRIKKMGMRNSRMVRNRFMVERERERSTDEHAAYMHE